MSLFDEALERRFVDGLAEFAAGAGHELNNPLTVISGHAQALLKTEDNLGKRRRLASIVDQANRAYEMIADLRAFARPPKPEICSIRVSSFFEDWIRRERRRTETRSVVVESTPGGADVLFESDPNMLAAILDALGKNAFEATRDGERVCYFWTTTDDGGADSRRRLAFNVENEGPNISEKERELLFAPFFSARQAGRGLGFGLPKARRFAEALGARLTCERSTRFDVGALWRLEFTLEIGTRPKENASERSKAIFSTEEKSN